MDINNLMENVRAFFSGQYKGMELSNSFISFEPLGCMIDPNDFSSDDEQISQIKATEQLSILGDRLPSIGDLFVPTTARRSTAYEMLVESATFSGSRITAGDKTAYVARFGEVKSTSVHKLQEARKSSLEMPEGSYLPVYGIPQKWYDPANAFWVSKSFSEKEKTDDPKTPALSPAAKTVFSQWRTKLVVNPSLLEAATRINPVNPSAPAAPVTPSVHPVPSFQTTTLNRAIIQPLAKPAALPVTPLIKTANPGAAIEIKRMSPLQHIRLADRLALTRDILKNDNTEVEPVAANGFSMSFD
ncbi:MAG: hypothetical protein QM664_11265 [Flavihumibacter sp.]